jgi:hypothetical protein
MFSFVMLFMFCDVWFWLILYSTVGWESLICERCNAYERTYVRMYVSMFVCMYVCIIVLPSTVQYFPIRVTKHSIYMLANMLLWRCKNIRKTDELCLKTGIRISIWSSRNQWFLAYSTGLYKSGTKIFRVTSHVIINFYPNFAHNLERR